MIIRGLSEIEEAANKLKRENEKKRLFKLSSGLEKAVAEPTDPEENLTDTEFSLKKHLEKLEKIDTHLANLQEKYNGKNGTFNLKTATRINSFAFAYVQPAIKSKYALAANILYLLEVQFK